MVGRYSDKGSSLKPARIDDATFLAIGRLIRACADIEDIITLYMCAISEINEGQAIILLGKSPVSAKLKIAQFCAKSRGGNFWENHKACFLNDEYPAIMHCRNIAAHGILLGENEDGQLSFLAPEITGGDGPVVSTQITSYLPEAFIIFANLAEKAVPKLAKILNVESSREKRLQQSLLPHRKSQPKAQPSRGRAPRPPTLRE